MGFRNGTFCNGGFLNGVTRCRVEVSYSLVIFVRLHGNKRPACLNLLTSS